MNHEIYEVCSRLCDDLTVANYDKKEFVLNMPSYDSVKQYVSNHVKPEQVQMCGIIVYGMIKMRVETFANLEEYERYYRIEDLKFVMYNNKRLSLDQF